MIQTILFPLRVVDWAMVQAYRGIGLAIVLPLRWLLAPLGLISNRFALILGVGLIAAPFYFGWIPYTVNTAVVVFLCLAVLRLSSKLQERLRKTLARMTRHFVEIVPPHFNASEKARPSVSGIPTESESSSPPPIKSYAHYGIASQVENETAYQLSGRLPSELQDFIKRA